jgi:2,4-dienoyl-CoA reductase-like NADH-dependent reductase (Old Yellow Enzyme family)/thioredoxin reductase
MTKYPLLFSEGKIGSVTIKNRVVMPPMGTILCGPDGEMTDHLIAYYAERAAGGTGLIITEIVSVEYLFGKALVSQLRLDNDRYIAGFSRLTGAVQKYGTKIFAQLHHAGRQTYTKFTDGKQIVAPSAIASKAIGIEPRALAADEIKELVQKFIDAAVRAQIAGFDGVELHGAHGYLINQFLSPHSNHRSDEYGKDRLRFTIEILQGIKKRCGSDFPVIVRFSADEFIADGINIQEGRRIGAAMADAGADALHVSSGTYESMPVIIEPYMYKEGWKSYLAQEVKQGLNIPVIAVGAIKRPAKAEEILSQKKADFVALGRAHLSDSQWAMKAQSGKEDSIITCIGCMHCIDSIFSMRKIECAVNARTGRELEFQEFNRDGMGRKVAVIGAGPAGLEAARILMLRGFQPVVYEQSNEAGGQLIPGCKPPDKEVIKWYQNSLLKNVEELNIEIKTGVKAQPQQVKNDDKPYAVIVATGAKPIVPSNIPGVNNENVFNAIDILNNPVLIQDKSRVSIIGGGMTGCELAELLANKNCMVTIIEMQSEPATDENEIIRTAMLGRLEENKNIEILTSHKLKSIKENAVELENLETGEKKQLSTDYTVLSLGLSPLVNEIRQWKEMFDKTFVVGDALSPSKVAFAIRTAFDVAYTLV